AVAIHLECREAELLRPIARARERPAHELRSGPLWAWRRRRWRSRVVAVVAATVRARFVRRFVRGLVCVFIRFWAAVQFGRDDDREIAHGRRRLRLSRFSRSRI